MKGLVLAIVLVLFSVPCFAQERWQLNTRDVPYVRYGERYSSPYANPPKLYSGGTYLGELSANRYAPDSTSNPYGRYGSVYSPDSINNPYGSHGRYSAQPVWVYPRNR